MSGRRALESLVVLVLTGSYAEAQPARCVVAVNVAQERVETVPPMRCTAGARIKWVIANASDEKYRVVFDSFMLSGKPAQPTDQSSYSQEVDAGDDKKLDSGRVRSDKEFASGGLQFATYKYTIRLRRPGSNTDVFVLDPELEVVPPTILPKPK